jgi:hypothetical protein
MGENDGLHDFYFCFKSIFYLKIILNYIFLMFSDDFDELISKYIYKKCILMYF